MEKGPTNAEIIAEGIFRDRVREAVANDASIVNRPPKYREGSTVSIRHIEVLATALIKKTEAGIYLVQIRYANGATEPGVFEEKQISESIN